MGAGVPSHPVLLPRRGAACHYGLTMRQAQVPSHAPLHPLHSYMVPLAHLAQSQPSIYQAHFPCSCGGAVRKAGALLAEICWQGGAAPAAAAEKACSASAGGARCGRACSQAWLCCFASTSQNWRGASLLAALAGSSSARQLEQRARSARRGLQRKARLAQSSRSRP